MSTPITQAALDAFKARVAFRGSTESDLVEGVTDLVATMARLERELYESRNAERLARVQLGAERQKVRALTAILESICEEWGRNHDTNPIGAGQRMETLASKALEKLEDEA